MVERVVRTAVLIAWTLLATSTSAFAQSPAPSGSGGPNVWGNIPGAVALLVPIVIGAALYVSYRIGGGHRDRPPGREGAISRALAAREESTRDA